MTLSKFDALRQQNTIYD